MHREFKKNGFLIKKFNDRSIVPKLKKIVKKHFYKSTSYYSRMSRAKFSKIALKCQNEMNNSNIIKIFHNSEKQLIKKLIKDDKTMYSSGGYLRVVRPIKLSKNVENLSWHRETFYCDRKFIHHAINIWFPILNVEKKNMLKYIPKSHLIHDKKIKRRRYKLKDNSIKKFSSEHKLGFAYAPKKIVSGVNLEKEKNFNILQGQYSLFSALLIHGNGENLSNKIRFAFGFGILPESKLKKTSRIIDSGRHKYVTLN